MPEKTNIRFAEDGDMEQVLNLLNSVFNKQQRSGYVRDKVYWNWKFRDSVYGPSILTVAEDTGKIIGVDNLWPWEFLYGGKVVKAVQPCDSAVHSDYRKMGLFKNMRRIGLKKAENQGCSLAFNFPNENSLPGNRSIGAHYLGRIPWWVKILNPVNLVKSKLFHSKHKDFYLPEQYKLNTETIDELASQSKVIDDSISVHRVPGFHHWRYAAHPSRTYGMIEICKGGKKTVLIFTINLKGSVREMVIVDLIGDKSQKPKVIRSMAAAAREMEADFIAVMNNHPFGIEHLWTYRFMKKKLKNMVVTPIDQELSVDVSSIGNWSMVAGMHDSI